MHKKKVIIFGINDYGSLANYYLSTDSDYVVTGFCVDDEYMPDSERFENMPVYRWSDIPQVFSIDDILMFAPMSPKGMNSLREGVYNKIKAQGYEFASYISSRATVLSDSIGENCFILEDNTIQPFVRIGDNCVLWSGNHIGHHSEIQNNVTITSHCVVSGHCTVSDNSFLGVNCTLQDGVFLSPDTLVGAGALITRDVKEGGAVIPGNRSTSLPNKKSWDFL